MHFRKLCIYLFFLYLNIILKKTVDDKKTPLMSEFDELDNYSEKIEPKEILYKLLTSPKEAFKFINDYKFDKHVTLLLFLAGIVRSFDRATSKNMGDNLSLWGIIAFCVIVGGLFGWISYYIYASLISWTGRWFEGKANTQSILRVLAYSLFPSVLILILLIVEIAIYGNTLFQSDNDISNTGLINNIVYYGLLLCEVVLGIWSFVLSVIGISQIQKFSIWKALLNLLLPALLFISIILVIVLMFWVFR